MSSAAGIDLLAPIRELSNEIIDVSSKVFLEARRAANQAVHHICYHRANSFAKALRGAMVASCLEFDIVVDKGENLSDLDTGRFRYVII